MNKSLRSVTAAALAAAVSGALVLGFAHAAAAAGGAPPWEPDPSSVGGLLFYNSSGQQITGGSTSSAPIAAYVEGATIINSVDTKATLYGYLPVNGESPGQWSGEALGRSTTYPNSSAPGALATATFPVETGGTGDESIAGLASDFPNKDTSNDGYAGMYQLRLKTSAPGVAATTKYDSADIEITGSTWSVVYPTPTPGLSVASTNTGGTAVAGCNGGAAGDTAGGPGCDVLGNLSRTAKDTFAVTINNSVSGDEYEAAVCNSDASQSSPLTGIQAGCSGYAGEYNATGNGGTITISVPFTPGKQDLSNAKEGGPWPYSKCPETGPQYADGVSCIIAAADLTQAKAALGGADLTPWTSDVLMGWVAKSTSGVWNDKKGAELKVKGGFATAGLYSDPADGGADVIGCQAYDPDDVPPGGDGADAASWGSDPLCDSVYNADSATALGSSETGAWGENVVAELVAVTTASGTTPVSPPTAVGSGEANAGLCPAGATTCTPAASGTTPTSANLINDAGGVGIDVSCTLLLDDFSAAPGDVFTFDLVGVGLGPTESYEGASGDSSIINVTIGAAPTGRNICDEKAS